MRKVIILFVLFVIFFGIAIGLVVREEQDKKKAVVPIENQSESKNSDVKTELDTAKTSSSSTSSVISSSSSMPLVILYPQNNQTVNSTSILVKGKTAPSVSVIINEFELTSGDDGSFSKSLSLDEGENYINIIAYNENGDVAETELSIVREVTE